MIHCETTAANTGLPEKRLRLRCWRGVSVRGRKSTSQYHRPGKGWTGRCGVAGDEADR